MRRMEPVPIAELLRGCAGKWVALKDGKVIDAQETPDRLYMELHERGIRDATILRAPAEGEPELVGLG